MKTKEKEIQKKITELCELMGDNDRFIVFHKSGNVVDIALSSKEDETTDFKISSALASVIGSHLLGNVNNDGVERFSEIIIDAIEALIGTSPKASVKLQKRFLNASLFGLKTNIEKLMDDDDENDCENCEYLKECNEKDAIKYRKEHGIPKPKKGKKGGRKVDVN